MNISDTRTESVRKTWVEPKVEELAVHETAAFFGAGADGSAFSDTSAS